MRGFRDTEHPGDEPFQRARPGPSHPRPRIVGENTVVPAKRRSIGSKTFRKVHNTLYASEYQTMYEATGQWHVSNGLCQRMKKLQSNGVLGSANGGMWAAPQDLPAAVREYLRSSAQEVVNLRSEVERELSVTVRWTASLLWWRCAADERHDIVVNSVQWTMNDAQGWWLFEPASIFGVGFDEADIESSAAVRLSTEVRRDVVDLFRAHEQEPLAHELLREGRSLRQVSPRSALMLAFSALEVAVRELVTRLEPGTLKYMDDSDINLHTWLHYDLPDLLEKNHLLGEQQLAVRDIALPRIERDIVLKWRKVRNDIAHSPVSRGKVGTIEHRLADHDAFVDFFRASNDLLWIFDYYCGHKWAINHVSASTIAMWQPPT